MEHTGLEPVASTLPVWRAPNCANAPEDLMIKIDKIKAGAEGLEPSTFGFGDQRSTD